VLVILVRFYAENSLDRFLKKELKYQTPRKSILWKSSCFMGRDRLTDGQTDMTMITVGFRNFANAPANQSVNVV